MPSSIFLRQCLTDVATPLQLFNTLSATTDHAILLESTDADTRLARFSFLAWNPLIRFEVKDGQATVTFADSPDIDTFPCHNPWAWMRDTQAQWLADHHIDLKTIHESSVDKTLPAVGGWFGYTGYHAVQYNEAIPQQDHDPVNVPDIAYGFYTQVLVFDHLKRTLSFVSLLPNEGDNERVWADVCNAMSRPLPLERLPLLENPPDAFTDVVSNMSEQTYLDKVMQCKELVAQGEVFQIVLAQRFSLPTSSPSSPVGAGSVPARQPAKDIQDGRTQGSPLQSCFPINAYRALVATNPSPYAYILKQEGFWYVGSSPETFVDVDKDHVVLRALAGTRKRGKTIEEDQAMADELRADEKEVAEHKMLVDLARNDLGRVCQVGTVAVGTIAEIHFYTHVMHLATEVSGKKRPDKDAFDIFKTVLPRGTVSGAPKIRAMHHLSRLETERRGIYSGAVGYFDVLGNLKSCIAIRSALIKDGIAHVQAGAGVVYDSKPELEYLETKNKARSVLMALQWARGV